MSSDFCGARHQRGMGEKIFELALARSNAYILRGTRALKRWAKQNAGLFFFNFFEG